MRIQTFSVLVGGQACNARCPFCVSRMTPNPMSSKAPPVNWRNFEVAYKLALRAGATTVMLTGKGEPTLWPELISEYVTHTQGQFPLMELQTNGLAIADGKVDDPTLTLWYQNGLTTVAVSVVHWSMAENAKVYRPDREHFDIRSRVERLHRIGFSVRLTCMLLKDFVDNASRVVQMVDYARALGVEQLTLTPINAPQASADPNVAAWVRAHRLDAQTLVGTQELLESYGGPLMELSHGARVYDIEGQNVCLNNCLGSQAITDKTVVRNLIFHPDGHIRYDWQHKGSIIL